MPEETTTAVQVAQPQRIVVQDNSEFSAILDTGKFEQLWRISGVFAASQLVPSAFQGKRENCFLGLQMAFRLGVDPMMLMQNTYIVGGRPGMESKMIIALINSSGLFEDPLDYEISGKDPKDPKYKVRAVAIRKGTGKKCEGPWIDWDMVKAEGWDSKSGSKWKTIPSQMFCYRAAAFFGRLFCPERLLGMQTREELEDVGQQDTLTPVNSRAAEIASRFTQPEDTETGELSMTAEEIAEAGNGQRNEQPEANPESNPLYQSLCAAVTNYAEKIGEFPDDAMDALTKGRHSTLYELREKEDQYLNDLLLVVQTAVDKLQQS